MTAPTRDDRPGPGGVAPRPKVPRYYDGGPSMLVALLAGLELDASQAGCRFVESIRGVYSGVLSFKAPHRP